MDNNELKGLKRKNNQLIDTVIEKVKNEYPNDIDLIGVCGYFFTGDFHEKSDLDLSNTVCFLNHNYFKLGTKHQLEEMLEMERVPKHFEKYYNDMHKEHGTVSINQIQHFQANNLDGFAKEFEIAMKLYKGEYDKLQMKVCTYNSIEEFRNDYLSKRK